MKLKKIFSLGLAAAMTASLLAGCGSGNPASSTTAAATGGQAETTAAPAEPAAAGDSGVLYSNGGPTEFFETPWLNPGTYMYNKTLYAHLIFADENLAPVSGEGDLAKSYEMSDDGMTLAFELRDNIFWHDGEAITADDIQWSIEYALKTTVLNSVFRSTFEALKGAAAYEDGSAEHIEGIAVDGNKITLTFEKVAPDALLTFTQFAPLPKKYLADTDPISLQQAKYFQSPIGSGPFMVDEVQMNNYTTLKPFDKYYGGTANFTIHLNPSAGDSDANFVTNAKAGKLDYAYTKNIADVKALEGTPGLTIDTVNVRYTRLLYLNKFDKKDGKKAPLADERVRQAIAYALDMKSILDGVFEGAALPANSLTPDGADKVDGLNNYDYNPEKAKELLKEANWDPNTELDVVYYYTDQMTQDLMAIIQQYLAEVGIKMNARLVEGDLATILWKAPEDPVNGPSAVDWDMCYAANAALSLHEYYDRYQTGYSINSHTPSDPKLDELIAATNSSVDAEVQRKAFFELQKYENETLFELPLYYQPIFLLQSDKIVKGAKLGNPQFNYNWDIQNWEIK
ncbi:MULTISPECIES: ABC transporter substrate-binding protein [Hungatella]|uniref:ABC transporter substrate-binding protein n=1 Tax=Hungatella hathewayi TaxID=154046 RepID=A0AAW9WHS9_9FIRM|nr:MULTISPECIES: ABC transporter substrate-binding protein [Hungatella]MCQ4829626.1 ABC transporter substrate-binding protein [Hungatella sp. SL.1.14]MUB64559.1 ABC transporter substrate-binding protein [Hungatella hathewayi]CUQ11107.1 extracellular solute-binding protein [Hungatella hathewayi]